MIEYLYFVRFDNDDTSSFSYDEDVFDNFETAKGFARSAMSRHPEIHQMEIIRNDFGECIDSNNLGLVWSWKNEMSDILDNDEMTFSKADTFDNEDINSEFDYSDDDIVFETDCVARKQVPVDMTIEALIEEMEKNEDIVECKECYELAPKQECTYVEGRGYLCSTCAAESLDESAALTEGAYDFNNLKRLDAAEAKQQVLDELKNDVDAATFIDNGAVTYRYKNAQSYSGTPTTDGNIVDFAVLSNGTIELKIEDKRGNIIFRTLEQVFKQAPKGRDTYNFAAALKAAAKRADGNNKLSITQKRDMNVGDGIKATNSNGELLADELARHIVGIRYTIPCLHKHEDSYLESAIALADNELLTDKAKAAIERVYYNFFNLPFADALEAAGMVTDRLPADGNISDSNFFIETRWGGSCEITFDCPIKQLSSEAVAVIEAARLNTAKTKKAIDDSRTVDCYRLANELIKYFNNDINFYQTSAEELVAATTESLKETKSMLEVLEEPEDYRQHLTMCPECGTDSFDLETGICINCGFN